MKKNLRLVLSILVVMFFLSGCSGGRDLSTVKTSLYGHWKADNGYEYYFNDEGYTKVNADKEISNYKYKVLEHDEVKNLIQLKVINEEKTSEHIVEYIFSNDDRDRMVETINASSMQSTGEDYATAIVNELTASMDKEFVVEMEYIDSTENPKEK